MLRNLDMLPDTALGADELERKIEIILKTKETSLEPIQATDLLYENGQRKSLYKIFPNRIFYCDLMGRAMTNLENDKIARIFFRKNSQKTQISDVEAAYLFWKEKEWPALRTKIVYDLYVDHKDEKLAETFAPTTSLSPVNYSLSNALELIEKALAKDYAKEAQEKLDSKTSEPRFSLPGLANRWFSHFYRSKEAENQSVNPELRPLNTFTQKPKGS